MSVLVDAAEALELSTPLPMVTKLELAMSAAIAADLTGLWNRLNIRTAPSLSSPNIYCQELTPTIQLLYHMDTTTKPSLSRTCGGNRSIEQRLDVIGKSVKGLWLPS